MADKREFLVVIDGRESVSPAAGKASDSLGKLGDKAKKTERDFDGLDRKLRAHADTIGHLRAEIAKTGDTKLFGELGKQEREFSKLANLRKKFVEEGEEAATGFGAAFIGRVGPLLARMPISGPVGIALGAAALAAAPSIAATISGAIVGGASIGGVVGGAILASKDARVKAAFSDLGDEIGADLRDAARPFVPAMLDAARRIRSGFQPIKGDLKAIFAESSKFVAPLTEAALRAGKSITGGLRSLIEGAGGPAIQAIGDGLIGVGDALGDLFKSLSDNGPEAALALSDLFDVIEGGIKVVETILNPLTELYGKLRAAAALRAGDTDSLVRYIDAQRKSGEAASDAAKAYEEEGSAAYNTAQMVDLLTAALDRQVDEALTVAEANLRYKESLNDAKEAADKKRGVSVEEEGALLRLARATNDATRANDNNSESAATAKKRYDDARAAFIATAEKMGYTRQKAAELADQMLKLPKKHTIDININTAPAYASIKEVQRRINNVRGKTVTINVRREVDVYGDLDQGAMHGGVRAAGGPVKAGMIYTVGEQGRETFVAPRDGYIINNRDTAMMAAGGQPTGFAPQVGSGGGAWSLSILPGADRMLRELISKALLFELRTDAGTRQQMKAVLT